MNSTAHWYVVFVEDTLGEDTLDDGTDPDMYITLSDVPSGATYELTAEFVCGAGDADAECDGDLATLGLDGVGCEINVSGGASSTMNVFSSCAGSDDSGFLYLRVRATTHGGMCANYRVGLLITGRPI